jgi:stress response protein YsnF
MGTKVAPGSGMSSPAKKSKSAGGVVRAVREHVGIERTKTTTGKVRITTHTSERVEQVDEPIVDETVEVERVPVGRVLDGPVAVRTEGDTTIFPVLEEQVVIERRLVLVEEVRVTARRTERRMRQEVPLRDQQVVVERTGPASTDHSEEGGTTHGKDGNRNLRQRGSSGQDDR